MKTIVVDDERLARKELINLLAEYPQIEVVAECSNAEEAKKAITAFHPELIFLDIQMPEKTGFELLEELDSTPEVIFVTAYDEYALKAFEVNALDYLLKPIQSERLKEAISKLVGGAKESASNEKQPDGRLTGEDQIFIKDGEKCWFVHLHEIRMFESEGNYVRIYFRNFKPLVLKSLNNLELRLDAKTFFRANRKYIVNLKYIKHIENWFNGGLQVELETGEKIEISRRQATRFKEMMSL
ncbi:MAG: LytR/AlgR family response regulator transcription factor [Flavobacteriales bacterium]